MEEENVTSASGETELGLEQVNPLPVSGQITEGDEMHPSHRSTPSPNQGLSSESEYDSPTPPLPPRPNKFHGPPSTWRTWTAAERELAASLDQLRARDLAVHLYNAHALKRRARAIDKQRQRGDSEREVNGKAWVPPKVWTAWPMGPNEVPREDETKVWEDEVDPGFWKRRRIIKPSEALEDAIVGEVLRNATHIFQSRQWEEEEPSGSLERSSNIKSRDESNFGNELLIGASEDEDHSSAEDEREIETEAELESGTESESPNEGNGQRQSASETEGEIGRGRRRMTTRSQSGGARKSTKNQPKSERKPRRSLSKDDKSETTNLASEVEGLDTMKPVLMADDERAREILQPTIHHILAKLDHLLMGLHQARQAYLPGAYDSASETQTDADELPEAESGKRSISGRSKSRSRVSKNELSRDASMRSTRRSRGRSKSVASPNSDFQDAQNVSSPSRSPSRKPRRRRSRSPESRARLLRKSQARLGLRDWSDVLGIASMKGWDSTVVARAAGRCAALFGEGMTFRTLEEGMQEVKEVSFLPNEILRKEDLSGNDKPLSEQSESEDEMLGGVHVDGFLKPLQAKKSWKVRGA